MLLTESRTHYRRNILIAIIISEILIISVFLVSPKTSEINKEVIYKEPLIIFDEVPRTLQSLPVQKQRPEIPPVYISDEVNAFEVLEDVNLTPIGSNPKTNFSTDFADMSNLRTVRVAPRQIFEAVPANADNDFNGKLRLSLKINEKGQVINHRIIFNSLECTDCLNDIIKAAYRSKWEPAIVNGKNADCWVEKSYIFN